ncbi:MAG: hypothetical protein ABEI39_05900 [Halobacteriales archaeon]
MDLQQQSEGALVRRYEYDDRTTVVADLGPGAEASVDVVDGTAILVAGDRQRELDLPEGDVQAVNNNGVVTIEVYA